MISYTTTTASVTALLILITTASSAVYGQNVDSGPDQLVIDSLPEGVMNPIDELLNRHPLSIAEEFTDLLMKDMKRIRNHCEQMELEVERQTNTAVRNLSEYQQHIQAIMNTDYSNMTLEDNQVIQNSFAQAFNRLFKEEQKKEKEISVNCSHEFQQIVKQKMKAAMEYSKELLDKSPDDFVKLLDDVSKYNIELEQARDQCMEEYPTHETAMINPLMTGSASHECKQIEVQILSQFVHEFVIRCASLLGAGNGNISHTIVSMLSNQIPEIFPRPYIDSVIELRPVEDEETTNETPTEETFMYTEEEDDGNDNDRTSDKHHYGNQDHHGNHHHGSDKPHPSRPVLIFDFITQPPTFAFNQEITRSMQATPTSEPVVISDEFGVDMTYLVIIISGVVSFILLVLIIITGVVIVKCHRKYGRKNWSKLSEDQKVVRMKQSGYINPTYEFFDKVTATPTNK